MVREDGGNEGNVPITILLGSRPDLSLMFLLNMSLNSFQLMHWSRSSSTSHTISSTSCRLARCPSCLSISFTSAMLIFLSGRAASSFRSCVSSSIRRCV